MAKNRIYGVGEPVWLRDSRGEIDGITAVEIMDAIGFGSFREWMHIPWVLENPTTPKPEVVKRMTEIIDRAIELDIEVTGMSHHWFLPEGCIDRKGDSMPRRDLTPGSLYMKTLAMLEQSWYTLVSCFPQVPMWEVGNEWDADPFLYPDGHGGRWKPGAFTQDEKADIALDMMYFSARGIRRANPGAKVVSFSPCRLAPQHGSDLPYYLPENYTVAQMLERLYSRIASGRFWSEKTDDYFDLVAWHPYLTHDAPPNDTWKEFNDAAYRVMQRWGDGHKKVLITEFGYTDSGNPEKEKQHALYYERIYRYLADMPYIHAMHIFRLYEDESMVKNWKPGMFGGPYEQYFGIFREPHNGQTPRQKAVEIQKLIGGTDDLWKFRTK